MKQQPDYQKQDKIYAFDSLYTTNHIQTLKILLPCLNPPLQKNLALYIKFLEFCYTFSFLQTHPYAIKGCDFDTSPANWDMFADDLIPFLSKEEGQKLKSLKQSMELLKKFESMQKMAEQMKDILPDDFSPDIIKQMMSASKNENTTNQTTKSEDTSIPSSNEDTPIILKNLLNEKQQALYEQFHERLQNLIN